MPADLLCAELPAAFRPSGLDGHHTLGCSQARCADWGAKQAFRPVIVVFHIFGGRNLVLSNGSYPRKGPAEHQKKTQMKDILIAPLLWLGFAFSWRLFFSKQWDEVELVCQSFAFCWTN